MKIEKLRIFSPGKAVKIDGLHEKGFVYSPCKYCGEWISNSGRAANAHYQKHVRKGDVR